MDEKAYKIYNKTMQGIKDSYELVESLKQGDILTSSGKDLILMKGDFIHVYNQGTHYKLSVSDFVELYGKSSFYLYEEKIEIDESKDENYYKYYKK